METKQAQAGAKVHYIFLALNEGPRCAEATVEHVYVEKPDHVDLTLADGKKVHNVGYNESRKRGWHWPEPE